MRMESQKILYFSIRSYLSKNGFPIGSFGKKYKVHLPDQYSDTPGTPVDAEKLQSALAQNPDTILSLPNQTEDVTESVTALTVTTWGVERGDDGRLAPSSAAQKEK